MMLSFGHASNILLIGTASVQWNMTRYPFLKENVDKDVCLKTHPFDVFWGDTGA